MVNLSTTYSELPMQIERRNSRSNALALRGRFNESRYMAKRFGVEQSNRKHHGSMDISAISRLFENEEDRRDPAEGQDLDTALEMNQLECDGDRKEEERMPVPMVRVSAHRDDNEHSDAQNEEEEDNEVVDTPNVSSRLQLPGLSAQETQTPCFGTTPYRGATFQQLLDEGSETEVIERRHPMTLSTPLPKAKCIDALYPDSVHGARSPLKLLVQRIDAAETEEQRPSIVKSCTKQIRHRILLVLQRLYHEAHETGIISVESFDILDHAVRCALDDDDIAVLSQVIEDCFKISKLATMPYSKCRNKVTQYILFKRLAQAIEVGLVFSNSFEELQSKMACIPAIAEHEFLREILQDLAESVQRIQADWLEFQTIYPEIYSSVQTRHALQRMVHVESAFIEDLFQRGLLDEVEYSRMIDHLSQTQHRLYFESFYSVSLLNASNAEKKQILLSTVFVSKLTQQDLARYHEKMAFLMNNLGDPRFTAKGHAILKKEQSPSNGLFILVSGTASILTADSDTNHLPQLFLSKGAIIGGYSYLTGRPPFNDIVAKTDCECYFLANKVLAKLLRNEDESVALLWKQISSYLILSQFRGSLASFEEAEIIKTCHDGEYREYGRNKMDGLCLAIPHRMALLLDGTATAIATDDLFGAPDVLMPCDFYQMAPGSKVLIFNNADLRGVSSRLCPPQIIQHGTPNVRRRRPRFRNM